MGMWNDPDLSSVFLPREWEVHSLNLELFTHFPSLIRRGNPITRFEILNPSIVFSAQLPPSTFLMLELAPGQQYCCLVTSPFALQVIYFIIRYKCLFYCYKRSIFVVILHRIVTNLFFNVNVQSICVHDNLHLSKGLYHSI